MKRNIEASHNLCRIDDRGGRSFLCKAMHGDAFKCKYYKEPTNNGDEWWCRHEGPSHYSCKCKEAQKEAACDLILEKL